MPLAAVPFSAFTLSPGPYAITALIAADCSQGRSSFQALYQLATTSSSSATADVFSVVMPRHQAGDALALLVCGQELSCKQQLSCRRTSVLVWPISTSPVWPVPLPVPLVWPWPLVRPFCSAWAHASAFRKLAPVRLSERWMLRGVRGALGDLLDFLQDQAGYIFHCLKTCHVCTLLCKGMCQASC